MNSNSTTRQELDRAAPGLARLARALVEGDLAAAPGAAERLVRDAIDDVARDGHGPGELRIGLFRRLIELNRARVAAGGGDARAAGAGSKPASSPIANFLFNPGEALRDMKPECREALLLVVLEGLGYAETGAILGLPAEVVTRRVAEARLSLDEHIRVAGAPGPGGSRPPWLRVVK